VFIRDGVRSRRTTHWTPLRVTQKTPRRNCRQSKLKIDRKVNNYIELWLILEYWENKPNKYTRNSSWFLFTSAGTL